MQDSGREHKANIVPKLYSNIVLGDLFAHEITENSFSVLSGDGDVTWGAVMHNHSGVIGIVGSARTKQYFLITPQGKRRLILFYFTKRGVIYF